MTFLYLSLLLFALNTAVVSAHPMLLSALDGFEKTLFIQEQLFTPLEIEEVSYYIVRRAGTAQEKRDAQEKNDIVQPAESYGDSTEVVLSNFANVVSHFFSIVANPHNPERVCDSVKEMLCGMVNIAKEAVKNGDVDLDDIDEAQLLRYAEELSIKLEEPITKFVLSKSAEISDENIM